MAFVAMLIAGSARADEVKVRGARPADETTSGCRVDGGRAGGNRQGGSGLDICSGYLGLGKESGDPYCERAEAAEGKAAYRKEYPLKDLIGLVPLTDLGDGVYKGEAGGPHPDGQNVLPEKHLGARLELAASVVSWAPTGINHPTA